VRCDQVRTLQRNQRCERTVPLADVPEGDLPQADDVPVGGRLRDQLVASIGRLPPRQSAVVTLRIVGDLPFKEIARLEGISQNSAKVSYHYAVTRLREWLRRG
jgi:DNA-directed RNA polymerase specialized sigma24 family protein